MSAYLCMFKYQHIRLVITLEEFEEELHRFLSTQDFTQGSIHYLFLLCISVSYSFQIILTFHARTPSPVGSSVLITSKNSCDPPSARSNANWYANSLLPGTSDVSSGIVSDDEPSVTRMRVRDWT